MKVVDALPANTILRGKAYSYCIEKVLGQGSFGITYLARVKLVGSLGELQCDVTVAVKELFVRGFSQRSGTNVMVEYNKEVYDKYRNDFENEFYTLSKLKHPHVVKILESFESNNTTYFSMEYVDGETLNNYILSNGRLSDRESLTSISQIANALSFMHDNNVLHLDLNPHNIMRRKNGDLVLIDLGLSKQCHSVGERIAGGTSGYAPLEQASNNECRDAFRPTLDIYALGGVLYKMLTGKTPPDASVVFNTGFPKDVMIRQGVCDDIIFLVMWAMEPIRERRPQGVEVFLSEVNRILPNSSEECSSYVNDVCGEEEKYEQHVITSKIYDVCHGFHVYWDNDVSETNKKKVRHLLRAMHTIGEKPQIVCTEYGTKQVGTYPVMSLGENSWHYLCQLIRDDYNNQPVCNIRYALEAIHLLMRWTNLPFRLCSEDEIRYKSNYPSEYWQDLKTLCYSKDRKLKYRTYGINGCLNDVDTHNELLFTEFDVQIVCDGLKPVFCGGLFDVPCTQEFFDEISPIGFGLYKMRKGNLWNVTVPSSPMSKFLPADFTSISYIDIWNMPGPMMGYDYLGIVAERSDDVSYYEFKDGSFKLLETLSHEEVELRKMWT